MPRKNARLPLGMVMILAGLVLPGAAPEQLDRTVLPIPEPELEPIREIDIRKTTPPPLFQVKVPQGVPKVLVILVDNLGYAATKPFGGAINMPTLKRLARSGLVCTNFHTAPLCSPSRTALLTGRNMHSVNFGAISEMATAFPGMTSVRPQSKAPLPEILKLNGYSTAMFGKSHEFTPWETGITGPYNSWPTGWGFERFYGSIGGEADMFAPPLHDNTTLVDLPKDPNYYYQTDVAKKAVEWICAQKTMTSDKPFFIYYATPGTHSPAQVPEEWHNSRRVSSIWDGTITAKRSSRGRKDSASSRQHATHPQTQGDAGLGHAEQGPEDGLHAAPADLRRLRRDHDHEVGRMVQAIEDLGLMDNTLIIYCTGDNGASANGGIDGRFNTFYSFNQIPESLEDQLKNLINSVDRTLK